MVIEKIEGNISEIEIKSREIDRILLDHYGLAKHHQKVKSEQGDVYGISLDEGQLLHPGDIIYQDNIKVVFIELLPEECLIIKPKSNIQWARVAFNIGNMHHEAYINDDCILTPYDSVLESIMKKLKVDMKQCMCKLEGVRANITQGTFHHHHKERNLYD